jgi:hypothetical protein
MHTDWCALRCVTCPQVVVTVVVQREELPDTR